MTVLLETFDLKTSAFCDVINITSQVQDALERSELNNGIVNVHVAGSTGAISTVEYEPGLVQTDIKEFLEKIIPYKKDYAHHKTWHDYNGAGHLRSFLLKTSQTFPFHNKNLILGSWQNIIFIENDEKPRHRKIYVTLIGE
ncbi:MAG: secondary thiamine-phosphate synthase enzyme YjbQ [Promethearchaeota archaeon]|jgi:secondary thiamine-phosphate synthase enzyme